MSAKTITVEAAAPLNVTAMTTVHASTCPKLLCRRAPVIKVGQGFTARSVHQGSKVATNNANYAPIDTTHQAVVRRIVTVCRLAAVTARATR